MSSKMLTMETNVVKSYSPTGMEDEFPPRVSKSKSDKDLQNFDCENKPSKFLENKIVKRDEFNVILRERHHAKLLRKRGGFCMNPEQIRMPLRLNNIINISPEKEVSFLGFNLVRISSVDRVRLLSGSLSSLENDVPASEKVKKIVTKNLGLIKSQLLSDKGDTAISNNKECSALTLELLKSGCFSNFITKLTSLEFEDRKVASLLFCNILRRAANPDCYIVQYLVNNPQLLYGLLMSYNTQSVAFTSGRMLRECLRYESLAKIVFQSGKLYEIFKFLKVSTFEISSDAFLTFEFMLTEHKSLSSDFMLHNYDAFFSEFDSLLVCDNYVTQISSLRLLTKILLDRPFYDVMTKYVADVAKLKQVMILMKDGRANVQLEAYHVFKIFLANPDPTAPIKSIFVKNKERLMKFLQAFRDERYDERFTEEKAFLMKQLQDIQLTIPIPDSSEC